jgi:2-keto-4-pentenoate hydratase/2-oxohepta-3-ene-1,7-dioic acid hydratase in catechol pathway
MRFGTVIHDGRRFEVALRDDRYLPLESAHRGLDTVRGIAAGGASSLDRARAWADAQPPGAWRALDGVEEVGPPIEPGAIYTIGANYRSPDDPVGERPARPLVFGKAATSVAGQGGVIAWDRALTTNVDAECELGVVIGELAWRVDVSDAMRHVFGYTIVNDVSSRDPWLDGDQWLLGKSMTGFCPVGPWIVTADELAPDGLRLGCTINGTAIQDGTTADMRFGIAEIVSYLSHHLTLAPGDLIATGTPPRLAAPPGPDRHLEPGDVMTVWIEGIGALTSHIA